MSKSELEIVFSELKHKLVSMSYEISNSFEKLKDHMPPSNQSYNEEQLDELEKNITILTHFISGM